jgi:hypothetical protein
MAQEQDIKGLIFAAVAKKLFMKYSKHEAKICVTTACCVAQWQENKWLIFI